MKSTDLEKLLNSRIDFYGEDSVEVKALKGWLSNYNSDMKVKYINHSDLHDLIRGSFFPLIEFDPVTVREILRLGIIGVHEDETSLIKAYFNSIMVLFL